jgi:hypothetical protein
MKTITKVIALLFLSVAILIACDSPTPQPTINPTDVSGTAIAIFKTEIAETLTAAPTSTPTFLWPTPSSIPPTQTPYFPTPFDRHDPEAVLQAFFDAWNRNDWVARESLRPSSNIPKTYDEPVKYVRIVEMTNTSSSPTEYVYKVRFEIDMNCTGCSMHDGTYGWYFYFKWDPNRDAWYISKYGYP